MILNLERSVTLEGRCDLNVIKVIRLHCGLISLGKEESTRGLYMGLAACGSLDVSPLDQDFKEK